LSERLRTWKTNRGEGSTKRDIGTSLGVRKVLFNNSRPKEKKIEGLRRRGQCNSKKKKVRPGNHLKVKERFA